MSSPQPQELRIQPTPRVLVERRASGVAGPSSVLFPQERHPNAIGSTGLAVRDLPAAHADESGHAASILTTSKASTAAHITEHHVWTVGASKRQSTKSALRSGVLARHEQEFVLHSNRQDKDIGSGGSQAEVFPHALIDQQVHYAVAGYKSDATGGVSFYRTSVHRKDPQNVLLSHGRVSGRVMDVRNRSLHDDCITTGQRHSYSDSEIVAAAGSGKSAKGATHETFLTHPPPQPSVSAAGGGGDMDVDRVSLQSLQLQQQVGRSFMAGNEVIRRRSSAVTTDEATAEAVRSPGPQRRGSASPQRPRWNTSPRPAGDGVGSPQPVKHSGGFSPPAMPAAARRGSSASPPPPASAGGQLKSSSSFRSAQQAGYMPAADGESGLSRTTSFRDGAASVAVSISNHRRSSDVRVVSGASLRAPTAAQFSALAAPAAARHVHRSHSATSSLSNQPQRNAKNTSTGSALEHDCRDERCLHSRGDIMEVIVAKSQVRAMESQLLHEEIRREQLATALSAERERCHALESQLQRAETTLHAMQLQEQSDAQHWKAAYERRDGEYMQLSTAFDALKSEYTTARTAWESTANERADVEARLLMLRSSESIVEQLQGQLQKLMNEKSELASELSEVKARLSAAHAGSRQTPDEDIFRVPLVGRAVEVGRSSTVAQAHHTAVGIDQRTSPVQSVGLSSSGAAFATAVHIPTSSEVTTSISTRQVQSVSACGAALRSSQQLEAEILRLNEERASDERLRRELLRALSDKEKQLAALATAQTPTSHVPQPPRTPSAPLNNGVPPALSPSALATSPSLSSASLSNADSAVSSSAAQRRIVHRYADAASASSAAAVNHHKSMAMSSPLLSSAKQQQSASQLHMSTVATDSSHNRRNINDGTQHVRMATSATTSRATHTTSDSVDMLSHTMINERGETRETFTDTDGSYSAAAVHALPEATKVNTTVELNITDVSASDGRPADDESLLSGASPARLSATQRALF